LIGTDSADEGDAAPAGAHGVGAAATVEVNAGDVVAVIPRAVAVAVGGARGGMLAPAVATGSCATVGEALPPADLSLAAGPHASNPVEHSARTMRR
jgi:hypothetical protein